MFTRIPFGGVLDQEDGGNILLEDGFNLLYADEEQFIAQTFKPLMGFTERITWNTDVISTRVNEQRISLLTAPRIEYDYNFHFNEQDFREIKQVSKKFATQTFILPLWVDRSLVTSLLAADTVINIDTTSADYRIGEFVALLVSDVDIRLFTLLSKTNTSLTLDANIGSNLTNVNVCPAIKVLAKDGVTFSRNPVNHNMGKITFVAIKEKDIYDDSVLYTQYKSLDVLLDCQPILSGISEKIVKAQETFDNGYGLVEYDFINDYITRLMTCNFHTNQKTTRHKLRKFLAKMKGKRGAFWLPSFHNDMLLSGTTITASQLYIDVNAFGYGYYYEDNQYSDFVIEMKNGTRYFNRIVDTNRDNLVERFTIENPFGVIITIANIKRVMFMHKVRFDSDVAEFKFISGQIAQLSMPIKEVLE